jgi:chorismate mutase
MTLDENRRSLAALDEQIIELIARRQGIAAEIGRIKHRDALPIHDEEQHAQVLGRVFDSAVEHKIDPVSVQRVFEILIAMSEERQHECAGEGNLP